MKSEYPVVALCGPSGVGKGYTKNRLLERSGELFAEPIIVTTRPARSDDLGAIGRRTGVPEKEYQRLVEQGDIILDHKPFRVMGSPRYGFDSLSTANPKPLLTEVHSSIITDFFEKFNTRKLLVIGFLATRDVLIEGIVGRGGDLRDLDLRLAMSEIEQTEIEQAHSEGLITELYVCDKQSRATLQDEAVNRMLRFAREAV